MDLWSECWAWHLLVWCPLLFDRALLDRCLMAALISAPMDVSYVLQRILMFSMIWLVIRKVSVRLV
jgi:hypothetical protein